MAVLTWGSQGSHFNLTPEETRARAAEVFSWVEQGALRLEWTVMPLAQAREAHRAIVARSTTGKLLLDCAGGGSSSLEKL